jgi:hypothetical protein
MTNETCRDGSGGTIRMARNQVILPRADAACGKAFYNDRRTADGHRIALEFWNKATGCTREGYQLAVYRCKRCGGFHIGQRRIEKIIALKELQRLRASKDELQPDESRAYPEGPHSEAS